MAEPTNATVQPQQVEQPVQNVPTPTPAEVATPKPEVVAQGQGVGQEPKALTEQQILELIDKRANEIAGKKSLEAIKQAQSLTDKLDARLRKEVADRLKTFESVAGQPLTEAQKYLIEKQTREQIVQEQQPEAPQQQQPVQQQNPLMADVTRIAQKYNGTIVEMSDPEAASVKVNGSLGEWVESYERAVKAKADRIAPKQTPSVVDNGNPQGRIASTPVKGTAGIADGLSPIDYFKQAYKK